MPTTPLALCLVAFLLGAIPFGILAGRLKGVDLREHGSGNIGATNAMRILGKGTGSLVLLLDAAKGYLPILLGRSQGCTEIWLVTLGLCAILGHIYSPFVRFRGGKGVATTLGVLIGLDPMVAGLTLVGFLVGFLVSGRRVSVGSMVGALAQATLFWALPGRGLPVQLLATVVAVFVIARHRDNLRRLMRGEEKPLSLK